MFIGSMKGLGDNLFQRAFVKRLAKEQNIWIDTPWPEIYADLPNVFFVKSETSLRTQKKNVNRHSKWSKVPPGVPYRKISYGKEGIIPCMIRCFGLEPAGLDLPPLPPSPVGNDYIVVRPVTVRKEWRADTRNPLPQYVAQAASEARRRGYRVVSIADLQEGEEWALDPLPPADIEFHKGELNVEQLLSLVANAKAVIGGIGWIVPAAIAAKTNALIICGGQGGFNHPDLITDKQMDLSRIEFVLPDRFCKCTFKIHHCDKVISNYEQRIANWFDRLPALV